MAVEKERSKADPGPERKEKAVHGAAANDGTPARTVKVRRRRPCIADGPADGRTMLRTAVPGIGRVSAAGTDTVRSVAKAAPLRKVAKGDRRDAALPIAAPRRGREDRCRARDGTALKISRSPAEWTAPAASDNSGTAVSIVPKAGTTGQISGRRDHGDFADPTTSGKTVIDPHRRPNQKGTCPRPNRGLFLYR